MSKKETVQKKKKDAEIFKELKEECEAFFAKKEIELMEAMEKADPILGGTNSVIPELCTALGIASWFTAALQLRAIGSEMGPELIDAGTNLLGSNFMCSLQRAGIAMMENDLYPTPTMIVGTNSPCDAVVMLGQMLLNHPPWKEIPRFSLDVPYQKSEERMDYFAGQMREFVSFVEDHSNRKLDMDRLREVCEEANQAYQLMNEFQELKRSLPCPSEWNWGFDAYTIARILAPGTTEATDWVKRLVEAAEIRVKEEKGIDGVDEKIRYVWFDVLPSFSEKLFPRMEKEFGAVLIMDMFAYNPPWTLIDTSSEQEMFRSFARRFQTDDPMVRQAMATMEMYTGDIHRIVHDFSIDAVILPTHRGHKDINAAVKIIRDMCKHIDVPFTTIGCDMFDERFMSVDQIVEKMGIFFESAGLA